jgi:hypothetical protein
MDIGQTKIQAGSVTFALQHRYIDGGASHSQGSGGRGGTHADQGVCIQAVGNVDGKETELLRFDCFDNNPHYHYGPENKNERIMLDQTTAGNPIGWTVKQLRAHLPDMIKRAGYEAVARGINMGLVSRKLDEVESTAREMSAKKHSYTRHFRGDPVIEAGNIRFGLEMRTVGADGGAAIHLLGDVADQEIELIAFDCFRVNPHYHYGPRNKNERIFLDPTLVPDSLEWVLDQFKGGKLPKMIERAGYPSIAASLDTELVATKVRELESTIKSMAAATPRSMAVAAPR